MNDLQTSWSSGPCFDHLPFRIPRKTPILGQCSREIAFISALMCSKTGPTKKNYRHTHRRFPAHLSLVGDPCFDHSKRFLSSGKATNTGPIPDPGLLIRTRLIGSSGLLRSLALSSSCACGATIRGFDSLVLLQKYFLPTQITESR